MARRTKMEVDALTALTVEAIKEGRRKKLEQTKKEVSEKFDKEILPLLEEYKTLRDKMNTIEIKVKKKTRIFSYGNVNLLRKEFAEMHCKFKDVTASDIKNRIIVSGDLGAEIIIKNLVKEYV